MNGIPHKAALSARDINKQANSNFFIAFKNLPAHKKNALEVVYAIFRLFDDCVDEPFEAALKKESLNYWTNEFHKSQLGQNCHPVMNELKQVMDEFHIPAIYFEDLIAGCEQDLTQSRYNTLEDTLDYCYKVAGTVGLTCLKIFGHKSDTAEDSAKKLGYAFQLTNILRDVKEDLQRDRIYLPLNLMQKHGYSENDLKSQVMNENFKALMSELTQVAEDFYQQAYLEQKKDNNNLMRPAWVMSEVYHRLLKQIQAHCERVLQDKINLNPLQKLWIGFKLQFLK